MIIKKFNQLKDSEIDFLIEQHYNHWVKFNPIMDKSSTQLKFKNLYTQNKLPFGIALEDNEKIVGFCVFKIENLKKHAEYFPWLSDLMIFEKYRGKGYGKKLVELSEKILRDLGYDKIYVWTDQAPKFYKKLGFKFLKVIEKNEGGLGELFYKEI